MAVFGVLMVGGFVLAVVAFVLERRVLTRVQRGNLMVCPGCEYSLENSGSEGTCPECGRAFEIEEVRKGWVRCLKRWERAD
jgi:predicted amidophosphoribosyltransferase